MAGGLGRGGIAERSRGEHAGVRGARSSVVRHHNLCLWGRVGPWERRAGMSHLTYGEAGIVGLIQGVTELFPLSSLGHSVLIPAIVGGQWAKDLNVSAPNSPYLAFIVGLHVATAIAMIIFFWRDWVRIIAAFFGSVGAALRPAAGTVRWQPQGTDQTLAWVIILATIPGAIAGAPLQHVVTHVFAH